MVERGPEKAGVGGPIPSLGIFYLGGVNRAEAINEEGPKDYDLVIAAYCHRRIILPHTRLSCPGDDGGTPGDVNFQRKTLVLEPLPERGIPGYCNAKGKPE